MHRLETPNLLLRCWDPADAPMLQAAIAVNMEHLRPWIPWIAHEPETLQKKERRLRRFRARLEQGRDFIYGAFDPGQTKVLGGFGLHRRIGAGAAEIGYWVHVDHVGRGLGTEGAAAMVEVGFETLKLNRIEIHCDPRNVASAVIPPKLGFTLQVTVPGWVNSPSMKPRDTMIWTLLRSTCD